MREYENYQCYLHGYETAIIHTLLQSNKQKIAKAIKEGEYPLSLEWILRDAIMVLGNLRYKDKKDMYRHHVWRVYILSLLYI